MVENLAIIISVEKSVEFLRSCLISIKEFSSIKCNICIVDTIQDKYNIMNLIYEYEKYFLDISYVECKGEGKACTYIYGMQKALLMNCSHVWLLCDSMRLKEGTLDVLLEKNNQLNDSYGFLSSCILCKDELYIDDAPDLRDYDIWKQYQILEKRLFPIYYASFDGLFLPCKVIRKIGKPISKMKIGYDGYEYTKRIREQFTGYYVVESICQYISNENIGFNIVEDNNERIKYYKYVYRNDLYLSKQEDVRHLLFYFYRVCKDIFLIIKKSKFRKSYRILQIILGILLGVFYFPQIEKVWKYNE